jgi:hypothetical protein
MRYGDGQNNGKPPRARDFTNNPEYPHFLTIINLFDNWDKGIITAGLCPNRTIDEVNSPNVKSMREYYLM